MKPRTLLSVIGPGMLVAATGIGAGDLATASFSGSALGLAILWAVTLGAFMKFVLNEGLTRWQLATGRTFVEGCVDHLGRAASWLFLGYLLAWSFLVAAALMSAMGVTCHAIYPLWGVGADAARIDKIIYGVLASLAAVVLVQAGGYRLFEKVMSACIAVMFVVVLVTAAALRPDLGEVASGLLVPMIPDLQGDGVSWTLALIGGVGGTVTVLCYGYWIREEGRQGIEDLKICRIDLAAAYVMTAFFGFSMVIIGDSLGQLEGGGATLVVEIARKLETTFGDLGVLAKWAFLVGAFGAVFSSLLGVWQSVPYLFTDLWQLMRREPTAETTIDPRSFPYRAYLYGIALVPVVGMVAVDFQSMLKVYAVVGALFVPMLAAVLLLLNGRSEWVGERYRNSWYTVLALVATLLFFVVVSAHEIHAKLFG